MDATQIGSRSTCAYGIILLSYFDAEKSLLTSVFLTQRINYVIYK